MDQSVQEATIVKNYWKGSFFAKRKDRKNLTKKTFQNTEERTSTYTNLEVQTSGHSRSVFYCIHNYIIDFLLKYRIMYQYFNPFYRADQ